MSDKVHELVQRCRQARDMAYCPYSRFPVGAAVLTAGGDIITGCNVENASYGLTVCAERTAIQRAVVEGHRKFSAIAVTCDIEDHFVGPCGACRQVLMEVKRHHQTTISRRRVGTSNHRFCCVSCVPVWIGLDRVSDQTRWILQTDQPGGTPTAGVFSRSPPQELKASSSVWSICVS
uniref:Cytidine deaminase n=1 Tax=Sphaeramia orbicularis TaxID=375764 RepID=A0A672ZH17_9TELE